MRHLLRVRAEIYQWQELGQKEYGIAGKKLTERNLLEGKKSASSLTGAGQES